MHYRDRNAEYGYSIPGASFGHAAAARRRSPLGLGAALFCLLLGCRQAAAEDEGAPATLKNMSLEELMDIEVISTARHPSKLFEAASAIQVITSEDIRRSGATSLPEALRLADNLDVAQRSSHDWAITARGFNTALANKLLVMIDGRTVYTPLFSGVFWDSQNYLLADIDRIEVISGPGGSLWGANAVNGVINIITKSAQETQGGYLEAGAGDELKALGGARYGWMPAANVAMRVYAEGFDRGDEIGRANRAVSDGWHQAQGGFRLDANPSAKDVLTVQGDYYKADENALTGGTAESSGSNLLGRWSRQLSERSDMILQVYYDRTHLVDPVPEVVINNLKLAPAGILRDDLDTFDADFQYRSRVSKFYEVEWGFSYRHTRDDVTNVAALSFFPPTLEHDLYTGFISNEFTLRDNLSFIIGTKLEHNDYTGVEVEPSARLSWGFAENQMLWAAVSRAVRTPSRIDRDLSQPAPTQPLVILRGDADFTSESVVAHELGYRATIGKYLVTSISAYYNDYRDLRSTGITPTKILPFYFQNNLEGSTSGIDMTADLHVSDWWRLHFSYNPLHENLHVKPGTLDINKGHNETADPAQRWALRSSMDLPHRMELDVALRKIGSRPTNSGATLASLPGYMEMDVRLGWRVNERFDVALVGQNLLHPSHPEYGFPGPNLVEIERSVHGTLVWHF